jgi:Helicase conserved C-terminal domain
MDNSRVQARTLVVSQLRREIFGPSVGETYYGAPLEIREGIYHLDSRELEGPFHCPLDGEEALNNFSPYLKYGVGVLNPRTQPTSLQDDPVVASFLSDDEIALNPRIELSQNSSRYDTFELEDDLLDLSTTAGRVQSSMGLTFAMDLNHGTKINVEIAGGTYRSEHGFLEARPNHWWIRSPHTISLLIDLEIPEGTKIGKRGKTSLPKLENGVQLELHHYCRKIASYPNLLFATLVLENVTDSSDSTRHSFYQSSLRITEDDSKIAAYPENANLSKDSEYLSIAIQDRDQLTYAIGHGTATDWGLSDTQKRYVETNFFPSFEVPSITPNIDGLVLDMTLLSQDSWPNQKNILETLLVSYGNWVQRIEAEANLFENSWRQTAIENAKKCRRSLMRMQDAIKILDSNPLARKAFTLTNEAIVEQRYAVKREKRSVKIVNGIPIVEPAIASPKDRPSWRPFQLGFLLQAIPEIVDPTNPNREVVDLLFFPTGGGKTEAYLGLTAFSILMRRLKNPEDVGMNVLMRYTLRLLTSQQFTRAASLICCLEIIRTKNKELGNAPFKIGVWLGSDQTPNSLKQAKADLNELTRGNLEKNPFLLLKCPYCGTELGPVKGEGRGRRQAISGYYFVSSRFFFRCNDTNCPFGKLGSELPVVVIDEQIYEDRPDLVIGTVDKFAQIAWNDKTRNLFGFNELGDREVSPPSLIIQDELHLISGPLGSMAGLYEVVIQDLCTDKRNIAPVLPKIIASTATVARFQKQILALFSREDSVVFPPPPLNSKDSFFSRIEELEGVAAPGRLYVGVFASGYSSYQTIQVRVGTALIQAPVNIDELNRDPYWTGLWFFNSIRELGNTQTLIQSDMHEFSFVIHRRDQRKKRRFVNSDAVLELTSRMKSDEVPQAISQLENSLQVNSKEVLDICLASNIIEVGIDIDRLGLLVIAGQPKSTSQYIQVSGRVGRDWRKAPGLVITVYSPLKPRDRSHYERFRSYHQKLYHFVEATSVTPFSHAVLERAVHAILATHVRMNGASNKGPLPYPATEIEDARLIILDAVKKSSPQDLEVVESWLNRRIDEWNIWEKTKWNDRDGDTRQALIRPADVQLELNESNLFWKTPNSLRNVDAECPLEIFNFAHISNWGQSEEVKDA